MGARKLDAKILDLGRNCFLLRDFFSHHNQSRNVFKLVGLVRVKLVFRPVRVKGALVYNFKRFRHAFHSINKARLLRLRRLRLFFLTGAVLSVVGVGLRVGDTGGKGRFVHFLNASGHRVVKLFRLYANIFQLFVFRNVVVAGAYVLAKNVGEQVVGSRGFVGGRGLVRAFGNDFFGRLL